MRKKGLIIMINIEQFAIVLQTKEHGNKYFRVLRSETAVNNRAIYKTVMRARRYAEKYFIQYPTNTLCVKFSVSAFENNYRVGSPNMFDILYCSIRGEENFLNDTEQLAWLIKHVLGKNIHDFTFAGREYLPPGVVRYRTMSYHTLDDMEDITTIVRNRGTILVFNAHENNVFISAELLDKYSSALFGIVFVWKIFNVTRVADILQQVYGSYAKKFYRAVTKAYGNDKGGVYRLTANGYQRTTCLTRAEFERAAEKWWKKHKETRFIGNYTLGDWEE